jgi:hypothetical protein
MDHLRATRAKIATKKVLQAVRRRLKQLERTALQLNEPGEPLGGRFAIA